MLFNFSAPVDPTPAQMAPPGLCPEPISTTPLLPPPKHGDRGRASSGSKGAERRGRVWGGHLHTKEHSEPLVPWPREQCSRLDPFIKRVSGVRRQPPSAQAAHTGHFTAHHQLLCWLGFIPHPPLRPAGNECGTNPHPTPRLPATCCPLKALTGPQRGQPAEMKGWDSNWITPTSPRTKEAKKP